MIGRGKKKCYVKKKSGMWRNGFLVLAVIFFYKKESNLFYHFIVAINSEQPALIFIVSGVQSVHLIL